MQPFTKDQAIAIAGVLRHVRERVRIGELGVAVIDYAIEGGLEDMLDLHSAGFDRAAFASRVHLGHVPMSYDKDRGGLPDDTEELEAAGDIVDRLKGAETTPLGLWLVQAFDIISPISKNSDLTGSYLDVEKEAMPKILQKVEQMLEHLRVIPR